jgi:ABC-2 type transport system ATP-binding protein
VLAALQAHAAQHGPAITHFATARTKLEGVFLNLTGRSLRD